MLDSERMIETPTYPKPVRERPASGFARAVKIVLVVVVLAALGGLIYSGIRARIRTGRLGQDRNVGPGGSERVGDASETGLGD